MFTDAPEAIDLVLLDMTMPRMDGLEAFRKMRDLRADVRVILSSGYNEHDATKADEGPPAAFEP